MWQSPDGDAPVANTGHGLDPDQYPTGWHCGAGQRDDVDGDTLSVTSATVDIRSARSGQPNGTLGFTRPTTSLAHGSDPSGISDGARRHGQRDGQCWY
jgi:hypothetical protein